MLKTLLLCFLFFFPPLVKSLHLFRSVHMLIIVYSLFGVLPHTVEAPLLTMSHQTEYINKQTNLFFHVTRHPFGYMCCLLQWHNASAYSQTTVVVNSMSCPTNFLPVLQKELLQLITTA